MKTPKSKNKDLKAARKNLPKGSNVVIADARSDITIPFYSNTMQPTDDTLIQRGGGKGLKIYDEIERDTHAWAVLQKRKKVLIAREWTVEPGGEDQIDLDAAEFIEAQLKTLPYDRICEDMLDATLKGFSVSEIVWKRDGNYIVPDKIVSHDQRRFVFDLEWKLRLLTLGNMNDGLQLPERKFITHRHGVKGNNPYGLGLGTRLFWPVLFKREGVAFWMTFLEKFAGPTVIGKTPFGLDDGQQNMLLEILASVIQNSAVTVPMGTEVELLEATRAGNAGYEDWCSYWDKQISIATLGETLTTDIGDVGSKAASQTHADILQLLVDADGDLLSDTQSETLFKWMTEYNFPGAKVPKVWRVRPSNEKEQAEVREKKAKASTDENEAITAIVAISSKFENDDDARNYIQAFSPRDLDEDVLTALVANRNQFAQQQAEPSNPKKKDPRYDVKSNIITPEFAEPEEPIEILASQLDDITSPIITRAIDDIRASIEKAGDLEQARVLVLEAFASWDETELANMFEQAFQASALTGRDAVVEEMDEGGEDFADVDVFNQPFKEQVEFFNQKEPRPSKEWTDVFRGDHDRAFVVAGAKNRELVKDFQTVIGKAINDGTTLETFRKDFDDIVARHGWSYKGERGWRSKVIFETNIRTSYMAGRLQQMRDPAVIKARPYWQYKHGATRLPKIPRRQHRDWDGIVLKHDDPWWQIHFPPNGWMCSCGVRTLSLRDLKRLGKSGPDTSPATLQEPYLDKTTGKMIEKPQGIDFGWDYAPGDFWQRGLVPSAIEGQKANLAFQIDDVVPIADLVANGKAFKQKKLATGKDAEFYVGKFLNVFGAKLGQSVLFKDKAGGNVLVSDELFRDGRGNLKSLKRGREVHAAQLAEAIRDPDEIWIGVVDRAIPSAQGGGTEKVIDRRYIKADPKTGLLAIFELFQDVWTGKTAFQPLKKDSVKTDVNQINKRRGGKLVYKRPIK